MKEQIEKIDEGKKKHGRKKRTHGHKEKVVYLPDIIVPTEDHPGFRETRCADVAELGLTAGALQTARVPVPVHGQQQEPVLNPGPTPGTSFGNPRLVDGDRTVWCRRHAWTHHGQINVDAGKPNESGKSTCCRKSRELNISTERIM